MIRRIVVSFAALVLLSAGASAQRASELSSGARVRITPEQGRSFVGTVVSSTPDSITLMGERPVAEVRTAYGNVKAVEVSNGRGRLKGALVKGLIGLGGGIVAGAAIGAATYSEPEERECTPDPNALGFNCLFANSCFMVCSRTEAAAFVGVLGGGAGLIIGTIAGAITGHESWTTVRFR
jgi:hypothetical protein